MKDRGQEFTSIETATAEDWAKIGSRDNEEAELAWTADALLTLLDGQRYAPSFGMPVNNFAHNLQTASRAARAGETDEMVFAALFHDVLDHLDHTDHAFGAARLLKPFLSEDLYWLVEQHAVFQNAHFLNNAERYSLERERFRDHPMYEQTVMFCRHYDQTSFDPRYDNLELDAFEPLVRKIIARNMQGGKR